MINNAKSSYLWEKITKYITEINSFSKMDYSSANAKTVNCVKKGVFWTKNIKFILESITYGYISHVPKMPWNINIRRLKELLD